MTRPACPAALAALLLGAAGVSAQPAPAEPAALRGDSPQTRKRLAEAEQKLLGGKAADAVEQLQRVLDEAGDDLVTVDGKQFRPARWVAHRILAGLPPDALAAYQARVEEPARRLLDAGRRDRDARPLWQLLDRYFVSRPAQEGLLLLGDYLFERGECYTAEQVWRRLVPDGGPDVRHPTPPADPAAVAARVVLAVIFQGEPDRAKAEFEAFAAKYPAAAGPFAGKTGPYVDALRGFLDRPPPRTPDAAAGRGWPTFGGGPGRDGRVGGPIPYHWPANPTWKKDLPAGGPAPGTVPPRPPFGHPVIVGSRVYVSDGSQVVAYDWKTGAMGEVGVPAAGPATLTAADGRLYARVGPPKPGAPEPDHTAIVCYAPAGDAGRPAPLRELWRVGVPDAEGKGPGVWEGPPLAAGGRVWAAFTRFEGGRAAHSVACFDPADPGEAPDRPAWVADVCDTPLSPGSPGRPRRELLTLAGRNVVLNTNGGAVVAVDAATGRRAWAFLYPRAARRVGEANRAADPAPAAAAAGRVFVAPADADRVYALDAETGRLLWESTPAEGAQIVGVSRNRVVVTVTGPVGGVRGLSVRTGSHRGPDGWAQYPPRGLLSYGRGFVTDDVIVWPSRNGLNFLDPDTGRPLAQPPAGLFGNVAYADGVLVVVTPTQIWGYEAERIPPVRPPLPEPRSQWIALIDAAEHDLANGDTRAGREKLGTAARGDFPAAWRAWAAARLLLLTSPTDDAAKLPQDVRDVLEPGLRNEWLLTAAGEFVSLGELIDRHTGREPPPRDLPPSPTLPAERKPDAFSGLAPTARVVRTTRLPPAAFPLQPIRGSPTPPKHLFAATTQHVVAVPTAAGPMTTSAAADRFTHAADTDDGFVAAGPFAVAVYGTGRGPEWVFRVPDTDPLPDRPGRPFVRTGVRPFTPQLSSFVLAGAWLTARVGDQHLLAIDLKARRVAWVLGADGRPRFDPLPWPGGVRFEPHLYAGGQLLIAQLSDGRRWMIRGTTGRVYDGDGGTFAGDVPDGFGEATARVPWPHPPAGVDANRVAFSDAAGLVRLVNLTTGRVKWTYEVGGDSSLAGDPPQVRAWGDTLLVAVRRNHGVELDRVEPADGESAWADGPAFFDASRIDLAAADADALRVYVPAGDGLFAYTLADGKPAWDVVLPPLHGGGGWVVRAGRGVVVAYPAEAVPAEPVADVWERVCGSLPGRPFGWRLPWLAETLYETWADRTLPVLLLDPGTGKLLKKLELQARGPCVTAWFAGDRAVIATGDRVTWLR